VSESFDDEELEGLCRRYATEAEARRLLYRAGFPERFIPAFSTPGAFWFDVNREISLGRMENGCTKIREVVRKDFPGASVSPTSPTAQQVTSPPAPSPSPAQAQSTSSSEGEPPGSRTQIRVAIIGGAAAVVAATIAIIPNLSGDDGSKKNSPSPTTSNSVVIDPDGGIRPHISINPTSGPVKATEIKVRATGFQSNESVKIEFFKGPGLTKFDGPYGSEKTWQADKNGVVSEELPVPDDVCCAGGELYVRVTSVKRHSEASDQATFTLT
jgi:hypothetical protein